MNTSIVLTILAEDQPGIIKTVSRVLHKHGGSWTQSSMSSLAGQFAGILLASVPTANSVACREELLGLESQGLHIIAHISGQATATVQTRECVLDLVGNDRQGIVHDITTILANHNVNVRELETVVEPASMAGGELFRARAELLVPVSTDIDLLESELENLANDLMVDIRLEK
jgi:glycine cleavage system regulatory protein